MIDLNATQAAIRAGYSEKGADVRGSELLGNRKVSERIAKLKAERSIRTQITQDRVLEELALIAFSNLDDYAEWGGDVHGGNVLKLKPSSSLTRQQKAVIKSIKHVRKSGKTDEDTLEIVREDKLSALDKLARHLNLYGEQDKPEDKSGLDTMIEALAEMRKKRRG